MILSDRELFSMFREFFPATSESEAASMINPGTRLNPASVDLRIGLTAFREAAPLAGRLWEEDEGWDDVDLGLYSERTPYVLRPGEFMGVATREPIRVPNGYAMDLRLKSTIARLGFEHSLAFWFDPGWGGADGAVGTMEIRNVSQYHRLRVWPGRRFAQVIVHRLTSDSVRPYAGRYQGARTVERAKKEIAR